MPKKFGKQNLAKKKSTKKMKKNFCFFIFTNCANLENFVEEKIRKKKNEKNFFLTNFTNFETNFEFFLFLQIVRISKIS